MAGPGREACRVAAALLALLAALPLGAQGAAPEVVTASAAERYGVASALTATQAPGANGGVAMALSDASTISGGLQLAPGPYTLVLRTFAPAGDQDGFFVEIAGTRTRRTAPIGSWGTLAFPFTVDQAGQALIAIIGQEPGMLVDDIVIVKGTVRDGQVDTTKLVAATGGERVGFQGLTRLRTACRLREFPPAPAKAALQEDFETSPQGVVGEHRVGPGQTGQGLVLDMPDGRLDLDVKALGPLAAGTVEWWVKPRPAAQVWLDQGWHYFLHGAPATPGGCRLDLSRHPSTQLQLTLAVGDRKESLQVPTNSLDPQQWHHLLVSWDLRGERHYLWLLVDGKGYQSFFPADAGVHAGFTPLQFSALQFGNTPSEDNTPLLPMDGAIDGIRVSATSVAERLVGEGGQ